MTVLPLGTTTPGRIGLFADSATLEDRIDATVELDYAPRYNIAPSTRLAVIRNDEPEVIDNPQIFIKLL